MYSDKGAQCTTTQKKSAKKSKTAKKLRSRKKRTEKSKTVQKPKIKKCTVHFARHNLAIGIDHHGIVVLSATTCCSPLQGQQAT
jgi:hypothetical protein